MTRSRKSCNARRIFFEPLEDRTLFSADLAAGGNPFGIVWPHPIVASKQQIRSGQPVTDSDYFATSDTINVAVVMTNIGDDITVSDVTIQIKLFVDGVEQQPVNLHFQNGAFLQTGHTFSGFGYQFHLQAGVHTLSMAGDTTNSIPESNEDNNTYSRQITVVGGTGITFANPPRSDTAGATLDPVRVLLKHLAGQSMLGEVVTLSVASGPGTLGGTLTAACDQDGIATFSDLRLTQAGSYKLTAADGPFEVTSPTFKISPAAVSELTFVQPPTDVTAGIRFNPAIQVLAADPFGNPVAGKLIRLGINTGPADATITGAISAKTNAGGIAEFSSTALKTAGDYTLAASYQLAANPAIVEVSNAFTVGTAAFNKLVFAALPGGAHGQVANAVIHAVDLFGNVVTSLNSGSVSLSLRAKPAGATLAGTITRNLVNGVATFDDLVFSVKGRYTLKAMLDIKSYVSPGFVLL